MNESLAPPATPRWNPRSVALIVLAWLILHIGCLFTPGLLDDVDSVYIEIAREMLLRHDFVTPYIDGIRFFDKPPLMYWLASASMYIFGPSAWAARLPLALLTLALFLATYALGLRLFARSSPPGAPDRGALYSALALATSIGPFLYTRFFIPDILICLWMTLAVHAFLVALDRIHPDRLQPNKPERPGAPSMTQFHRDMGGEERFPSAPKSALLPCLAFAFVTGLNLLTKGFIGLVFPLGFVFFYLLFTRQLRLLPKFHLLASTAVFAAVAAPWHILAALRNPPIALPSGLGLPTRGGWAWFYLYNEHVARFLSKRIPHDYGQVPIPLFWLLAAIWLFPWVAFLPAAVLRHIRRLRDDRTNQPALTLLLWTGVVMVFFTLSARQEYYSLPALPALALMAGGFLAAADRNDLEHAPPPGSALAPSVQWHKWMLVPLGCLCALAALYFAITAPTPKPGTDISDLLTQGGDYNLSLSHLFDLTGAAMGLFRGPLILFGCSMAAIGPLSYLLRRRHHTFAANLALAGAATCLLLAMHSGLARFYPTLGSKPLADAILADQASRAAHGSAPPVCTLANPGCDQSDDLIILDGELTSGSTLLFYTRQPLHLVNGRVNGPWYGSFWPDSPHVFETDASLHQLWASPHHIYLLTYHDDQRVPDLAHFGPVHVLASSGGKSILTN